VRRFLDRLYLASGAVAAAFVAAICFIVLLQVTLNALDKIAVLSGFAPPGLVIPSYAEFAGLFLAAATFFALAYSLRKGAHIRVSLLISHLSGRRRKAFELWAVFVGGSLSGIFTGYMFNLVYDSFRFGDVSIGLVRYEIWIPQLALAFGLLILCIAFIDEYVSILRGNEPSYDHDENLLSE
jgi:TRAP-type C4-dicarboxylate transport system permease small subunit